MRLAPLLSSLFKQKTAAPPQHRYAASASLNTCVLRAWMAAVRHSKLGKLCVPGCLLYTSDAADDM
eukprot:6014871-Alexandrium_andersonii.AAC.1